MSPPFILNCHLFCHVYHYDLHCSPCTQQPTIKQEMLSVSPVEVQEHRRYVLNMPSKVWQKQPVSVMCEIEELVRMPCLVCEKPLHLREISRTDSGRMHLLYSLYCPQPITIQSVDEVAKTCQGMGQVGDSSHFQPTRTRCLVASGCLWNLMFAQSICLGKRRLDWKKCVLRT